MKKTLQVMKFGGTSLGDASCIERAVEIVSSGTHEADVLVVVSAMGGVTNRLIEAATRSETGDRPAVSSILEELRKQHHSVISALIHSSAERDRIGRRVQELLQEGERLCEGTMLLRELTPRVLDTISSLGERLSAPLVAAVLAERGVPSEAIEATELVVTDSCHGAAEPYMNLTERRCKARLQTFRQRGIVPVITGFIGATQEGVLTTLGRGGSDYSATILGAALSADKVIIWTDVNGLMTADPRQVPDACTIPDISYREAAELAYFGAKVLHPKTLRPVMQSGIPLWIRNTFAPERAGTKITPEANGSGVKALTAMKDIALITVGGPGFFGVTDVVGRAFATIAAVRTDVLLISQSSSRNDICLIVPAAVAKQTIEALRREFAHDLEHEKVEHITVDYSAAIVSVVGQDMRGISGIVGRTFGALSKQDVGIIAIAQGSSDCNISFVVAQNEMKAALEAVHREFRLGTLEAEVFPVEPLSHPSTTWHYEPGRSSTVVD